MKLEERIIGFLKQHKEYMTHQEISTYLEVKRPTISKALKRLKDKGIIDMQSERIGRSTVKKVFLRDNNHGELLNNNIHGENNKIEEKEILNIYDEFKNNIELKKNQPIRKIPSAKEYSGLDFYQLDMEQLRTMLRLLKGRVDKCKGGEASSIKTLIPAIIEGLEFNLMYYNKGKVKND
ncbi:MAG: MarR family transcriptional regulator [Candidatus Thermoplasmatota archaeon]|nr:MarR family transcriptional regulator [Candidatus Thermoplasmatota archaeon]